MPLRAFYPKILPVTAFLVTIVPPDPAKAARGFDQSFAWLAMSAQQSGENASYVRRYNRHPRDVSTPRRDDARVSSLNMTAYQGVYAGRTVLVMSRPTKHVTIKPPSPVSC
jgi:hypothetical protein